MFRPVGSQPPAVYWRRRLLLVGTAVLVVVLLAVTLKVAFGDDGTTPSGQGGSSGLSTAGQPSSSGSPDASGSTGSSKPATSTSTTPTPTAATPQPCTAAALGVKAVTDKSTYQVGDDFGLVLQVTNTGTISCVEDLADSKIELIVYNGESRVWGSHDCKILAGTNDMTLVPDAPVRVTVVWSGQSSHANDQHTSTACEPRQVVGPGTYTLVAKLAGKEGTAAQFAIG